MATALNTIEATEFATALADATAFVANAFVSEVINLDITRNESEGMAPATYTATVTYRVAAAPVVAPLTADLANLEAAAVLVITERTYSKYNQITAALGLDLSGQGVKPYLVQGRAICNADGRAIWLATDNAMERLKTQYSSFTKARAEYWD